MSFLKITFGCMFSSKTNDLLNSIDNYITFNEINKKNINILIINSLKDNRDLNKFKNLTTHNKYKNYKFPKYVYHINVNKLDDINLQLLEECDYLAIDESQFFEDLEVFVKKYLKKDKYIHCAGLLSDSDKNTFGELYKLIPVADEVLHLKAFCKECNSSNKTAVFTKWIGGEKKEKIVVGCKNKYIAVCGKHY